MTYGDLQLYAIGALGPAIGVFLGVLIGLSISKRAGKTNWLFRESVYATAFLASALAFGVAILVRMLMGAA